VIAAMTIQSQMSWSPPASPALSHWAEQWYAISWAGLLIAGAVTALGACAAITFLVVHWRAATIRDAQLDWRASVMEMQTAQARKDTAEALERVANLNQEAAHLNRRNLSLAQLVQPRQMSGAQIHDVAQAWSSLAGRPVALWSYGLDLEGSALAEQIRTSLVGAHAIVVNNIGQLAATDRPRVGIQVAGADKHLVDSIFAGLHNLGDLDAATAELTGADAADGVPVEIFVGIKPFAGQADGRDNLAMSGGAVASATPQSSLGPTVVSFERRAALAR
jgi:hypothetical protein